ncbi:hypothetical protein KRP22_004087 [Phytophthora ramorum]|nr:hypothetical protein KRP22_10020 [Phytophthora ramorum]
MASFLKDEDDIRVFEAALSFVDEYSASTSLPSETATTFAALAADSADESHRTPCPSVPRPAPSFTIACRATSGMVPLIMTCQHAAGLSLSLSPNCEPLARQKSTKPKKAQSNPNRVRDEAQYELAFLREKVAELGQQLQSLQLNGPIGDSTFVPTVPSSLGQVPRVWKDMAIRQRRRRDEAQRENVRLRLIVERKRKMATGLSALLRKRLTQQGAECARDNNLYIPDRDTCVLDFQGDIGDFQDLFQHLQAAHLES